MRAGLRFAAAAIISAAAVNTLVAPSGASKFNGIARMPDVARSEQLTQRPSLLPYNNMAAAGAVVVDSSNSARFTVLSPRLIRMESIVGGTLKTFEDRATIAILNRNLPVPSFTHGENGGVLTITTAEVTLMYTVGTAFSQSTLSVTSNDGSSAFKQWSYGDAFAGNLLGTIRGLDQQGQTPLNCTQNQGIDDNGEFNHCEWGLVSRDGWSVYDDTINYALDENDWWSSNGTRRPLATYPGMDAVNPSNSPTYINGAVTATAADCLNLCMNDTMCLSGWVFDTNADTPNCWPLASMGGRKNVTSGRILGTVSNPTSNTDIADLYGFFHGHDYYGALADFILIGGKSIMAPRYVSGVWWSRWFDVNNADTAKIVDDYESRRMPLDVFVIDMDWHTKDNWSGFTFDGHLFPYAADSMEFLKRKGLAITLNIHDASGVNSWDAMFPALVSYLGLPANSTVVPFNLQNATVAYAVEDIVLGDLLYNKHIDFWWIDWQQGGDAGGMTGGKQNPTIWTDHLRCTDRHRNGDTTRGLVLARWGGMGGHRYQVGFSGDVVALNWANMAYQPYFSATSVNVGHGFWSHDIEGPAQDMEMYTRWIQIGSFSGTMRSHDRGMSGGGCANGATFDCSIVEPWNVPNVNMEANRLALQLREALLPYIYNGHRSAFDTGVGLIRPMYYDFPELDNSYLMDANGGAGNWFTQYMFGPSILFSPVTTPAVVMLGGAPGLASKTTWLPPGTWYDALTGVLTTVAIETYTVSKNYTLSEIPLWYKGGAVLPYMPLRSLPVVGLAQKQYTFLGFRVVPGGTAGSTTVYEDDGNSTAYLTDNAYVFTTAAYTSTASGLTLTISSTGSYPLFPASRAYQVKLLNTGVLQTVTVNGSPVPFNRWGALDTTGTMPTGNQWYYEASVIGAGLGPVIDVVGLSTASTVTITVTYDPATVGVAYGGVYGAITHAIAAKLNTDLDRSTPGSNEVAPAYMSVLASTGEALAYLAGTDSAAFAAAAAAVPGLLANATIEVAKDSSPRVPYSLALLAAAMV